MKTSKSLVVCLLSLIICLFIPITASAQQGPPNGLCQAPQTGWVALSYYACGPDNAWHLVGVMDANGNITIPGHLTTGNIGGANNTDYITGFLSSHTTSQTAFDVVGNSITIIWIPEAINPAFPFIAGYDELIAVGLGSSSIVASTNIATNCGFCANVGTTASTGKTVNLTNLVNFAANPPFKQGVGTSVVSKAIGFWALDQGGKSVDSYGLKIDAQTASSQGGVGWGIWAGTGPSQFTDYVKINGLQPALNSQSANYQMTYNDAFLLMDATGGARTATLPALSNATAGAEYTIKKSDGTNNVVTVASASFIDFAANWPDLVSQFDAITLVQGATQYYIKSIVAAGNCSANGSAAATSIVACGGASAGAISCDVAATGSICRVNDTAVTAKSDITITPAAGTWASARLGKTCAIPTTLPTVLLAQIVAGVSFDINMGTFSGNPACYMFHIDH